MVSNAIIQNTPTIFQRKMDLIFKKYQKFVLVYIEGILVFSQTLEDRYDHLNIVFSEFLKNGIIISKKKMELTKKYIDFLRMKIRNDKMKLQEHIVKKILDFPYKLEDIKTLVFLRAFKLCKNIYQRPRKTHRSFIQ